MQNKLTVVQIQNLRWVMLQAIEAAMPYAATEHMCRDVVTAAYPVADAERVRVELDYLEAGGLVSLERSESRPWAAKLTRDGRDVVDYTVDAPEGVSRPQRVPEGY